MTKRHCWKSKLEWLSETYGYDSDEYLSGLVSEDGSATCMLERDHVGPHEWTPDGEIIITFSPHDKCRGMA
jgi:hypothetical protein